jgi:hypothetical protein
MVVVWTLVAVLALVSGGLWLIYWRATTPELRRRLAVDARAEKAAERARIAAQPAQILCPHCGVRGQVTRRPVRRKRGISGGKATGAVLTGGASMLLTGLSRKESATQMHCGNCGTTWDVS